MTITTRYNDCIERCNPLHRPTNKIAHFLDKHPTVYKIVLLINHLFRAAVMVGIMFIPQISLYVSMSLCFVGSVFYRLTVERNCAYKFALPAFLGAAAFMLALPAIISMVNKTAFLSAASSCKAVASLLPILFYCIHIVLSVNYDVNKNLKLLAKPSCCQNLAIDDL